MRTSLIGRVGLLLGLVVALPLAVPTLAAPPAHAAKGGDGGQEMKAREAFAAGRYDEALDLFAKLYAQTLHPVYLRNIGRCYQKMRQPERALDKFREYLAKDKKLGAEERTEIEGYIKEMEALRDEQARQSAPPPSVAPINSTPTPTMSPPPAANLQPPAPTATSSATLVSPPVMGEAPIYRKWWFWGGIGAVVAGGIVAAVLLSSGGTTRPDCPDGVSCMP